VEKDLNEFGGDGGPEGSQVMGGHPKEKDAVAEEHGRVQSRHLGDQASVKPSPNTRQRSNLLETNNFNHGEIIYRTNILLMVVMPTFNCRISK
jgi:hypothetical protein